MLLGTSAGFEAEVSCAMVTWALVEVVSGATAATAVVIGDVVRAAGGDLLTVEAVLMVCGSGGSVR